MRLTPLAAVAAACILTLTACGDDGDDPKPSDAQDSPSAPTDQPTDVPTDFSTDLPTAEPGGPKGSGKKVCNALDPAEVGDILGGTVERSPVSATGCSFSAPAGETARTLSISAIELSAVGGVDAFKQSMASLAGGELQEVPDVGDEAFVGVTEGPTGSLANGAVVVGESLYQLLVLPGEGASADEATAAAVELLTLVGGAA